MSRVTASFGAAHAATRFAALQLLGLRVRCSAASAFARIAAAWFTTNASARRADVLQVSRVGTAVVVGADGLDEVRDAERALRADPRQAHPRVPDRDRRLGASAWPASAGFFLPATAATDGSPAAPRSATSASRPDPGLRSPPPIRGRILTPARICRLAKHRPDGLERLPRGRDPQRLARADRRRRREGGPRRHVHLARHRPRRLGRRRRRDPRRRGRRLSGRTTRAPASTRSAPRP